MKSELARLERVLPDDSFYLPINAEFNDRVKYSQANAISNELFAKLAVDKILNRGILSKLHGLLSFGNSRRWIWEGKLAGRIYFMTHWLPRIFPETIFFRIFKLWKLKGTAHQRKQI